MFYKRRDDTIVAVSVDGSGDVFRVLGERPLFQAFQRGFLTTFDVLPDGERLLVINASTERQASLVVVTSWTEMVASGGSTR